jgi:two-component system phosphate regulon sensor histidine kinase PhoR
MRKQQSVLLTRYWDVNDLLKQFGNELKQVLLSVMTSPKPNILILISSIALILLLLIQVNWIFQAAKIKEALFNEKANMVLAKASEALASDQVACGQIKASLDKGGATQIRQEEINKINLLLKRYMEQYNFSVDYSFVVVKPSLNHFTARSSNGLSDYVYQKQLQEVAGAPQIELKLLLPEKRQFILGEMGPLFFTSVALILVVFVLFWRTSLSLIREKTIAMQTTDFLNNMTHEFKTPLTNIKLAGQMMQKDGHSDRYAGIILSENEKLRLRVEQTLSMSALERGEIRLTKQELDIHKLINETVACMQVQLDEKRGRADVQLSATEHIISGDPTQLSIVLCNLIDNAIKYARSVPVLKISTENRNHYLVITIEDNGIGIPQQFHAMVFDKFFRVPTGDIHDIKGFGLGLTYVKKIIELHEGSINLQSAAERGTIFSIILPYA